MDLFIPTWRTHETQVFLFRRSDKKQSKIGIKINQQLTSFHASAALGLRQIIG